MGARTSAGWPGLPPAHLPPLSGPAPPVHPPLPPPRTAVRPLGAVRPWTQAQAQIQARFRNWGSRVRGAGFWGWSRSRHGLFPFHQLQLGLLAAHHLGVAAGYRGSSDTTCDSSPAPSRHRYRKPLAPTQGAGNQSLTRLIGAPKRHFRCSAPYRRRVFVRTPRPHCYARILSELWTSYGSS